MTNCYKRMTVNQHCDRVRWDPSEVAEKLPDSGFRLIYPKQAPGPDPDIYTKIQKKAAQMWKLATGTVPTKRPGLDTEDGEKKKKRRHKKKLHKKKTKRVGGSTANGKRILSQSDSDSSSSSGESGDESNFDAQGGPIAEELAVNDLLKQVKHSKNNADLNLSESNCSPKKARTLPQHHQREAI